jgi:predicted metal-dependent HD superfamily phosphohydrolase
MQGPVAQAWLAAIRELGGVPTAAAGELERRYRQPHRRYHNLRHVEAVLADCSWLADEVGLSRHPRLHVVLGACAHDVVYDAHPGDDERASADWVRDRLARAGLPYEVGERVAALVLATASHVGKPDDIACCVLLDADLAILAVDGDEYTRYVEGVRAEYAALAEEAWRAGRADVLRSLLSRPVLYATEPARLRWDARARRNLAIELAALSY